MTLRSYIKKQGSIAQAARSLGVPFQTIFRWVHGKSKPSAAYVRLLDAEGIRK